MPAFLTRSSLRDDLIQLGVRPGDVIFVHAGLRRVGRILGGPDALIGALRDATAPDGTLVAYTDWQADHEELAANDGGVPETWRRHAPGFDAETSRAARANGALPEFLRTTPGAVRSGNPGASVAAIGRRARDIVADHALDYGYGENSPFAKLIALGGKVALIGAPLDTMTLLHHAEHLARISGKRLRRMDVPFATAEGAIWRRCEEFDTSDPVVDGLAADYFATILEEFLASGCGAQGLVGAAPSVLVDAGEITRFATAWLERRCG